MMTNHDDEEKIFSQKSYTVSSFISKIKRVDIEYILSVFLNNPDIFCEKPLTHLQVLYENNSSDERTVLLLLRQKWLRAQVNDCLQYSLQFLMS